MTYVPWFYILEFGPIINLSNNPTTSEEAEVATIVSGENVYVVWRDNDPGNLDIFFRRSTDGGVHFDPTENLSNNLGNSFNSHIAVSGTNVYVIWTDDRTGNNEILFRRSTNNGASFDPTENLSNNLGNSVNPQIALSGNDVHVVWQDHNPTFFDVFYKRSTDNGANFDATENISNNARNSEIPQISSSGDNVYVVWTDDTVGPGNAETFFRRSIDSGDTFSPTENLSDDAGSSTKPQIVSLGDSVYVAWEDDTPLPGPKEVFFRASIDGGANFAATKNLSNNPADSFEPKISVSGNSVYVIWTEDQDIFFIRSIDNGNNFGPVINLSDNSGDSSVPEISASGMNVYVVWQDTDPGNNDIFFRSSTDGGATFGASQNISDNSGTSHTPLLTASVKGVYVVWTDNTAAVNSEIFFRASLPSLTPQESIENLIQTVRDLDNVIFRVETALITQLRIALIFVSDNNLSNDFISCAIMDRFSTSVITLATRGLLTEATDLLQQNTRSQECHRMY